MRMLNILGVAWAVLTLQLTAVCGQSLYYNEALLKSYVRLSQQLRTETKATRFDLQMRAVTTSNDVTTKAAEISSAHADAFMTIADAQMNTTDLSNKAKIVFTPALRAEMNPSYTDANQPLFGAVALDHSTGYNAPTGHLLIAKPGIYLLEFKVQTSDYSGVYSKIAVTSAAGETKNTFNTYHDWEVSPFFEMLKLDAGDKVLMYSMASANSWAYPQRVIPGTATQFSLRYLGEDVPLGYTTSAPAAAAGTTPWWG